MLYIGIPAHNEATTIGVLLWRLRSVLADVSREYEVVVYDDASTDETAKTLEPYKRVLPLTVLSGSRRLGYAGAIDALVRHVARTTRYPRRDALLLLQGDFTDPPALVPEFLRRFEGGADLIIGERGTAGDAPTAVRRLWSASRWVLRPFVGVTDVRDLTSSYRLVRIAVLRDLIKSVGDAPVATGDVWAANADFLLRTAALSRRVETIPVTPTFGVRTRETRRAAWPDTVALAKWGWGRRGQRVAVKVIARTVEVPAEVEEAPSEPMERVGVPERAERPERGERRPRREGGGRDGGGRDGGGRDGGERKSRERPAPRDREPKPERAAGTELVSGAVLSGTESEATDTPTREARTRRKRGRRDRTRKEAGTAPEASADQQPTTDALAQGDARNASPLALPDDRPASRIGRASADADVDSGNPDAAAGSEGSDAIDTSDEGVARRRKRTRRGRRRKSGAAGDAAETDSAGEAPQADQPRAELPQADRAPRAESPYAEDQEPAGRHESAGSPESAGQRERSSDDGEAAADQGVGAKRRRSRRGRRGGARRREGNGEGTTDAVGDGNGGGDNSAGSEGGGRDDSGPGRADPGVA